MHTLLGIMIGAWAMWFIIATNTGDGNYKKDDFCIGIGIMLSIITIAFLCVLIKYI